MGGRVDDRYDLDEDQLDRFCELVPEYMNGVIDWRDKQTTAERENEPFPIDDDIFAETMHNMQEVFPTSILHTAKIR